MEDAVVNKEPLDIVPEAFIAPRKKLNDLTLESLGNDDDFNIASSSNGSDSTAAGMPRSSSVTGFGAILQQIRRAENLASHSRPAEALELLRPVLAKRSEDPDVLCLQASCFAASGNKAQALAAFAGALTADPSHLRALLGCAALHKDSGLLHEAKDFLEKAHGIVRKHRNRRQQQIEGDTSSDSDKGASSGSDSSSRQEQEQEQQSSVLLQAESTQLYEQITQALAIVLTDLGTQVKAANGPGWKGYYKQALAVAPAYSAAHYNLGVAAAEHGDYEEAIQRYQKAVELEPRYAEAWCNMGVIYKSQGRLDQAIAAYEAALISAPTLEMIKLNLATALTEKGTALKTSGDLVGGIKVYERALALCPKYGEALYNLGVAYTEAKELDKAIFMYQMAIVAAPRCAEAHNNLGVLHREQGNLEAALTCYEAALTVRPNFPQGLNNLAVLYTQQGRAAEALNLLQAAIMAKPDYAEAYNNLGVLQRDVGDAVAAVDSYLRCCEYDPDNRNSGQNRLLALNYVHHGEEELVCAAHAAWGQRFQQLHPQLPPLHPSPEDILEAGKTTTTTSFSVSTTTTPNKRPLVVGYLSPDLLLHSVSYFAEAPLRHHNPSRVHTIVYSVCPKPDNKTHRLAAAVSAAGGTWRDVAHLTEKELADAVRADKVDILVELTGHTANNRLGTMARRPAPVQVTWIGYPNSTGLRSIDYRFTDAICDPLDTTQTFTEQLVRLPGCFLCYTPAQDAPPVAPLPAVRNGYITFGSFNALAKQTPEVLAVWARILRSIPASRLVLKNKPFVCDVVRQKFWSAFESEGISRDRVDLLPLTVTTKDHLVQYGLMDICLDPWPYAGTTTTAEALFMGVPCLTLAGRCHAHNVGASLVSALGLEHDWVARNVDEYVAKAQELSSDTEVLVGLREGLRKKMERSVLCDAVRFVDQLESTYRDLWNKWLNGDGHCGSGGGGSVEE
ncbi:hypothetical protein Ndes2526B_g02615 [Nannochloris sp. 'desiccata']|nr:putative UDP-N-acetylglucosamine--peptide N-acetylglucosaminyltransferase SPINDLY [Chlorella desiccata (nom. nud.)]